MKDLKRGHEISRQEIVEFLAIEKEREQERNQKQRDLEIRIANKVWQERRMEERRVIRAKTLKNDTQRTSTILKENIREPDGISQDIFPPNQEIAPQQRPRSSSAPRHSTIQPPAQKMLLERFQISVSLSIC